MKLILVFATLCYANRDDCCPFLEVRFAQNWHKHLDSYLEFNQSGKSLGIITIMCLLSVRIIDYSYMNDDLHLAYLNTTEQRYP